MQIWNPDRAPSEESPPLEDRQSAALSDYARRSFEASMTQADGSLCFINQELGIIPDFRA
jgi:hypothetical protein